MGCNCGGKKSRTASAAKVEYIVTAPDGQSKTYRNEVEAQAAVRRFGPGSAIQQKPAR